MMSPRNWLIKEIMKSFFIILFFASFALLANAESDAFSEYRKLAGASLKRCTELNISSDVTAEGRAKVLSCVREEKALAKQRYNELLKSVDKPSSKEALKTTLVKLYVCLDLTNGDGNDSMATINNRLSQPTINLVESLERFEVERY